MSLFVKFFPDLSACVRRFILCCMSVAWYCKISFVCCFDLLFSREMYFWMHVLGAIVVLVLTVAPPKVAKEERPKQS
jgi:hypothetical protein